jgi:hypothetical protein
LFDTAWRVTSMHVGRDTKQQLNQALALPALLQLLRSSASWPEIAASHQIADLEAAQQEVTQATPPAPSDQPSEALVRAAVLRVIDPTTLSESDADTLRPHVADPDATRGSFAPTRESIIKAVGSREKLKKARGTTRRRTTRSA